MSIFVGGLPSGKYLFDCSVSLEKPLIPGLEGILPSGKNWKPGWGCRPGQHCLAYKLLLKCSCFIPEPRISGSRATSA